MKNHGFTLLELIITIALAAILLGLAVPSMHTFIQNNRITGQTNELVAALNLARSESVKRGRPAWLCASTNPDDESPTCSGGNDWDDGWLVMAATSGGDEVIRVWRANDLQAGIAFHAPGGANQQIRYAPSGMLASPAGTDPCPNAICIDLEIADAGCRAGDDLGFRRIAVPPTGGARVETRDCED